MPLINLNDYQLAAKQKLSQGIFDYIQSGADDEITKEENRLAFSRIWLLPRVLVNVSDITTNTDVLGIGINPPIIIAPTAFHGLAHPDAEIATAKAAENSNTLMIVSTMANTSLEDIKKHVQKAWFQLYPYKNRSITKELVQRAERAGYLAIVLTADCPIMGNRENDKRNHFKLPKNCIAANFPSQLNDVSFKTDESTVAVYTDNNFDNQFTWSDIEWLKSITKLPIILKGVLHPDDAELAIKYGVSAIIVSNHGGRQVDTTPSGIEILPKIANKVQKKIPILVDGGIRRGTDIIKALALGANAVLIGRPILWGLCVNGQEGVESILKILKKELVMNMALCGHPSISSICSAGDTVIEQRHNYSEG